MGSVILVGAGPGSVGLLTLRGREAIEMAQVVLYDRLVGAEILALLPPQAECVDVGKNSGNHPVPQEEINRLLLQYAQQGKRVVRLKGGDPYLFGRGAEELELLIEHGIPFEVVPGVSSSLAVPAFAGIPVTHRDFCSSVHIITGRAKRGTQAKIDYKSLVRLGGTLVFMMSVAALPEICAGLLEAGMNAETPAALIENGTHYCQRKLVATVSTLAQEAKIQKFAPPCVVVVGKVCKLSDQLDWFTQRPLHGRCVLVTRPRRTAGRLSALLQEQGCGTIEYPCVRTQPVDAPLPSLQGYDWIVFTSAYGADLFFQKLLEAEQDIRSLGNVRFAAVGTETARALTRRGLLVDYIPTVFDGVHLAKGLIEKLPSPQKMLLYRARAGAPELAENLREAGHDVRDFAAYDTLYENPDAEAIRELLEKGKIHYVTFTSASTVKGFVRSLPELDFTKIRAVCIGVQTQQEADQYGMQTLVAEEATLHAMVRCILQQEGK